MIDVCIPIVDQHEITTRCIKGLLTCAAGPVHVIVVDNGSSTPLPVPRLRPGDKYTLIRYETNQGVLHSLRDGLANAISPTLVHQHNDVLVHEIGWDLRLQDAFHADLKLGLMGYFGAPGVGPDGARLAPHSNMLGKEWGTAGHLHGTLLLHQHPAVVFDSLAMIWRVATLRDVGIDDSLPPHHWFDRILTLKTIVAGWRAATIGIGFDHYGSATYGSPTARPRFNTFAADWLKQHGLDPTDDPDLALYMYGKSLFDKEFGWRLPLRVDANYNLEWSA